VKTANAEKFGAYHVGGYNKGGKVHRKHREDGGGMTGANDPIGQYIANDKTAAPAAMANTRPAPSRPSTAQIIQNAKDLQSMDKQSAARRAAQNAADQAAARQQMMKTEPFKKGGKVEGHRSHKAGGGFQPGMLNDPRALAAAQANSANARANVAPSRFAFSGNPSPLRPATALKKGGKVHSHPDVAEDKALIRKMVKHDALTGKKHGGSADGEKWIQGAIKHKGALHHELHVPEGKNISEKKLHKAEHSSNPKLAKRAHLAETLKHLHHKADGGSTGAGDGKRTDRPQNVYSPKYNEEAVNKAITTSRQKIGGREASNIKSLLKGWRGNKADGGSAMEKGRYMIEKMGNPPKGGRIARATGGKAGKGKTNINIVIAPPRGHMDGQPPMGGMPPMPPRPQGQPMPVPPPQGMPPQGPQGMPMAMPMQMPQGMPPQARKRGGRTYPIHDGAGGGEGRLQKIKAYGATPVKGKDHY